MPVAKELPNSQLTYNRCKMVCCDCSGWGEQGEDKHFGALVGQFNSVAQWCGFNCFWTTMELCDTEEEDTSDAQTTLVR